MTPNSPPPVSGGSKAEIPPQSLEAEVSVLGAILRDKKVLLDVRELLDAEDFYKESHQKIYQAILNLDDKRQAIDLITVTEEIKHLNALERVGGASYLSGLLDSVATSSHASYYAQIIKDKSVLRRLISAGNEIAKQAFEADQDIANLVDMAERKIFEVSRQRAKKDFRNFSELVHQTYEQIASIEKGQPFAAGIRSGIQDLDRLVSGFHSGNFVILGARPSLGKTSLALQIASHVSVAQKMPVAFFSLEMTAEELVQRLLCMLAKVNLKSLRDGYPSGQDLANLANAAGALAEAPLYIDDSSYMTSHDLRTKARRAKSDHNIQMIVIDYLQLLHESRRMESRQVEVTHISQGLKALAKELAIPVLALCQLSRGMEGGGGQKKRKPELADLRESGSLEQDADVVMLLYKDSKKGEEEDTANDNIRILEVAKNRNGPWGTVTLNFKKEITFFYRAELNRDSGGEE